VAKSETREEAGGKEGAAFRAAPAPDEAEGSVTDWPMGAESTRWSPVRTSPLAAKMFMFAFNESTTRTSR
jgi:hypothetical protein